MTGALTPVESRGGVLVKRDDTFEVDGSRGGKVRTCAALVDEAVAGGYPGVITAGSRQSPQVNIVATLAAARGIPCRVHVPAGPDTPELVAAAARGAEVVRHRPGYNSVIVSRAHRDAQETGWFEVPFGMECSEAVRQTSGQVRSLVGIDVARCVIPVGSGMSLAGVLTGLADLGLDIPVLGVMVGADPTKRLDRYAPPMWRTQVDLVRSPLDYHDHADTCDLEGLQLDPVYEAKCLPYLEDGDLLWVVGRRENLPQTKRSM